MPRFFFPFAFAASIAAAAAGCASLDLAGEGLSDATTGTTGAGGAGTGGAGAGGEEPMPIACPTDSAQSVACYGDDVERQDAFGVAVDATGAAVVTGSFHGTLDFGGGVALSASPDVEAVFVVKLDPAGAPVWARRLGGDQGNGYGTSVAFDPSGDIVVAGEYGGAGDFGAEHVETVGAQDAFIAKLTPEGDVRWVREYGSDVIFDEGTETQHGATAFAARVAVSAGGDVLVTGESDVLLDFGDPALKTGGDGSVFALQLSPDGVPQWSRWFHGSLGEGIAVDPAGDVVVSGLADGALVAKISAGGDLVWEKILSASLASGDAITTDAAGDVIVIGSFLETIAIDGTTLTSAGSFDVFVAKLDPDGGLLWASSFGSADLDAAQDVATDAADNLLLTGHFRGTGVDFGGGPLENRGDDDLFAVKLTGAGEHLWSRGYGDNLTQIGRGIAAEPQGDALVVGLIGAVDAYQTDVLIARFGP
jgi:hypothetical protein